MATTRGQGGNGGRNKVAVGARVSPSKPRKKRTTTGCMTCLTVISILTVIMIVGTLWASAYGIMKISGMTKNMPTDVTVPELSETSLMYASDGTFLKEFFKENRDFATINEIPGALQQAVISVEDERFYSHRGVDPEGVVRAFMEFLKTKSFKQGASTITMQVANQIYLTREKTWNRKVKQALLALSMEKKYSKQEILEYYLNLNYFGEGAHGVKAATRIYYGKELETFKAETPQNVADCAMLAAVLKAPGLYSPFKNPDAALKRRNAVLDKMLELQFISPGLHADSVATPLPVKRFYRPSYFPYFVSYTVDVLTDKKGAFPYSRDDLHTLGLRIFTTLDPKMQYWAEKAIVNGVIAANLFLAPGKSGSDSNLLAYARSTDVNVLGLKDADSYKEFIDNSADEHCNICVKNKQAAGDGLCGKLTASFTGLPGVTRKPDGCYVSSIYEGDGALKSPVQAKIDQVNHARETALQTVRVHQGALVAMEANTGKVLAMVGGVDYKMYKFNRAYQAERQPGSSFKPFVYMTALKQGYPMESMVADSKFCVGTGGRAWCPVNYGGSHGGGGMVTFHKALQFSKNIPAVRVGQMVGYEKIIELCRQLGITGHLDPTPALPLGTANISPLDMATAYSAIANGGFRVKPTAVEKIYDSTGKLRYKYEFKRGPQVLEDNVVARIVPVMQDIVRAGTGTRAQLGRPAAGKTGTTNSFKDAWFVGYTPDVAASVWIGNDNESELLCTSSYARGSCGGTHIAGGDVPAPIWRDFMKHAAAIRGYKEFKLPPTTPMKAKTVGKGEGEDDEEDDEETEEGEILEGTQPPEGERGTPEMIIDEEEFRTFDEEPERIQEPVPDEELPFEKPEPKSEPRGEEPIAPPGPYEDDDTNLNP